MKVVEGEAIQVPEAESPCCILDGLLKVPNVSIEGNVSCFETINIINIHDGCCDKHKHAFLFSISFFDFLKFSFFLIK